METIFKRWWLLLLNGILFLILGVISLAYPVTALFSVAVYIGVVALVAGIGSIVVALSNMRIRGWGWRLLEGVIDVIFGLLMLGNPLLSAAMIPVLIGIWVFVRGLMYVADSLAWRRRGSGDWSRYLIVGILLLVLGFLMMVDDRFGLLPVAYLLAFIFLLVGFGSLIVAVGMRRADRELRRQERDGAFRPIGFSYSPIRISDLRFRPVCVILRTDKS